MKTASPAVRARSTQKQSIFLVRCRPAFCSLKLGKHGERDMQCNAPRWIVRLHFISQFLQAIPRPREQSSFPEPSLDCSIEMLQANDGKKIHGP